MPDWDHITDVTKAHIGAKFRTTELGLVRIAHNLGLQTMTPDEIIGHCRQIILATPLGRVEVRGKNYYFYCTKFAAVLTINQSSLGIITAKRFG